MNYPIMKAEVALKVKLDQVEEIITLDVNRYLLYIFINLFYFLIYKLDSNL
jgi:hypothetical protein